MRYYFIVILIELIDLCIELKIERNCGYSLKMLNNFEDRSYFIDVVFMFVENVNYSIYFYGNGNEK